MEQIGLLFNLYKKLELLFGVQKMEFRTFTSAIGEMEHETNWVVLLTTTTFA
jgi:hypothetical protein